MKTKTKQKILKVLAICILFLGNSHLLAQSNSSVTQTVCASSLAEPYLISPPSAGSIYQWTLSGGGTINPISTSNSITIDWGAIAGGPHTLEVIESNGGCSSALVTLDITIVDGPTATAGPPADVCVGDIYTLSGSATNQVSVLWTTTGDGVFTNASLLNPDYTPGPGDIATGTVGLTLTSTGSGPVGSSCATNSSTITLTIHQLPTAAVGPDDNVCAGSNYTLSGASTNGTGLWTTSGNGTFTASTSATSDYLPGSNDILNGTVVLTWTVTGSAPSTLACNSSTSSMTLTIDASPIATAGPPADICAGDIYTLSGSATNQVSVLWTTSGNGTFTNASSATSDYTPSANDILNGTVVLTLTATGTAPAGSACATNSSNLTLTIHQVPTAIAGSDDDLCEGNNYTLSGSSTNGTGLWTTSGNGTFTASTSATSDYVPSANDILNGTVVLTWTVTGSAPITLACNSAANSMTLTIIPVPTAFAGPADNICENNPYTLSLATATNQLSVVWTTSGDGTWSNVSATSLNPDYTPGPGDILNGTVDLTLTVTGNAPCLPIPSTMTLTVIPNPTPGPILHN